jgi:GNAT superfamily N-acetyltransferase
MKDIKLVYSLNEEIFVRLCDELEPDLGSLMRETFSEWCNGVRDGRFWEAWLMVEDGMEDKDAIGLCGLYSLSGDNKDRKELWLGWLGVVPSTRGIGVGTNVLDKLKYMAVINGCTDLLVYVDRWKGPVGWYNRNGFKVVSTVGEYLKNNIMVDESEFESKDDIVMKCNLGTTAAFLSDVLSGRSLPGDIDTYVSKWHECPLFDNVTLTTFLGLTREQYASYMNGSSALGDIIESYRVSTFDSHGVHASLVAWSTVMKDRIESDLKAFSEGKDVVYSLAGNMVLLKTRDKMGFCKSIEARITSMDSLGLLLDTFKETMLTNNKTQ